MITGYIGNFKVYNNWLILIFVCGEGKPSDVAKWRVILFRLYLSDESK